MVVEKLLMDINGVICTMIKLNNKKVEFHHFNDGSCRFLCEPVSSANITWLYDNDEEIIQLYYLVSHLKAYKCAIELTMPYVNSARQDRVQNKDDVFTLKYFCNLVNSLNMDKINIFDPHSRTTPALLNNVEVEMPTDIIMDLLKEHSKAILCFPDIGAMEKYSRYFNDDLFFAFGVKDRDWSSQKIKSLKIMGAKHMIAGHDILLCDDIVSRGSTIYLAATQLKELGAKNIYVYVSHCENTVLNHTETATGLLDIPNLITKLYTTNSIYRGNHPKIEVIKEF